MQIQHPGLITVSAVPQMMLQTHEELMLLALSLYMHPFYVLETALLTSLATLVWIA